MGSLGYDSGASNGCQAIPRHQLESDQSVVIFRPCAISIAGRRRGFHAQEEEESIRDARGTPSERRQALTN